MKNGAQTGPISTDELRGLLTMGSLRGDTLVWREGLTGWLPASGQPEFAGASVATPPPTTSVGGAPSEFTPDAKDVEQNKVFGILCYLPPFLFIVSLITARQSRFAMFHCNQAIVLTIAAIALSILGMIASAVLVFIPILGAIVSVLLHLGLFIGIFALALIGLINAANGRCKPLPLIGNRFTLIK